MKITIVIGAFLPCPPIEGGAVEKMWYELAKKFIQKGYSVDIISKSMSQLRDGFDEYGINHIRIHGYTAPSNIIFRLIKDFKYTMRTLSKIDEESSIIVSNTFWLPILSSLKNKKKLYVDVARMPKGQLQFYKNIGRLRANSTPVKDAIFKENAKANISIIPNPLPFELKNDTNPILKENLILFVGRIHPEKGIHLLINSFKLIKNKNWRLKVIGPSQLDAGGGGQVYLKKLQDSAKGFNNIEISDPIYDRDLLIAEYQKAKIFVYPSLAEKGETFGLAPLEAMACGAVPILSELECFHDFVIDNHNGVFFDHRKENALTILRDKLDYLIDNQNELELLRNHAISVRETHSVDHIANLFLEDFLKIQKENGGE